MSANVGFEQFVGSNNIQMLDEPYKFNEKDGELRRSKPWHTDPNYFSVSLYIVIHLYGV